MKAILKFDLPEEREEFEVAAKGSSYRAALEEFSNYLRSEMKHGEHSARQMTVFENVRKSFFNILTEFDIELG